jgi:hypothetical protein
VKTRRFELIQLLRYKDDKKNLLSGRTILTATVYINVGSYFIYLKVVRWRRFHFKMNKMIEDINEKEFYPGTQLVVLHEPKIKIKEIVIRGVYDKTIN